MRHLPVRGFENYLIFYLPRDEGVDVTRVLHRSRDVEHLFHTQEE